jgi:wyosine [tRNA(Phe)-imidazoG37] synthetase (radical SAM superfamily)
VDPDEVLAQIEPRLASKPDFITLSGSGEPTLFAPLDELIAGIKRLTRTPVAVLTNGSLLCRQDVQLELRNADLVMPTLAAADEQTFRRIHRPHEDISFARTIEGIARFRRGFRGRYWLEVFLLAGINDSPEQIRRISDCTERISPDRVQLNTVDRPPADAMAQPVTPGTLRQIATAFSPPAQVIANVAQVGSPSMDTDGDEQRILELLERRPCTVEDIASGLNVHRVSVIKSVERLVRASQIAECVIAGRRYYRVTGS